MRFQTPPDPQQPAAQTHGRARVAVISASVRHGRTSQHIADWVLARLEAAAPTHVGAVDLIDLTEIALPDDALLVPGGGPATDVSQRITSAEAFVIVTPEYNHSFPASLKRLLDWHYREWRLKPATIVAYGVHGGHAAIEQLRGVLAELSMVATRRSPGLLAPWNALNETGRYEPGADTARALDAALAELLWWAGVLSEARATRPFPT